MTDNTEPPFPGPDPGQGRSEPQLPPYPTGANQPGQPLPPGSWGQPPGMPGNPYQPGQPLPPGYGAPPPPATRRISIGAAVGGAFIPIGLSLVLLAGGLFRTYAGAIIFAMVALLGGGVLVFATKPAIGRGLGLGLMIGWAILSIVSAGFCTGFQRIG